MCTIRTGDLPCMFYEFSKAGQSSARSSTLAGKMAKWLAAASHNEFTVTGLAWSQLSRLSKLNTPGPSQPYGSKYTNKTFFGP